MKFLNEVFCKLGLVRLGITTNVSKGLHGENFLEIEKNKNTQPLRGI
jgi:hypothetical protein